jgi:hypothetical protein
MFSKGLEEKEDSVGERKLQERSGDQAGCEGRDCDGTQARECHPEPAGEAALCVSSSHTSVRS